MAVEQITMLYDGKILKGNMLTYREEYVEATVEETVTLIVGDHIQMFYKGRSYDMRILQSRPHWVALFPATSELFQLTSKRVTEDDRRKTHRFNFESIAVIFDGQRHVFANTVDISRGGLGIVLSNSVISTNKFKMNINMNYQASLGCSEEWISFQFVVRNVMETQHGLRYGTEILHIGEKELNNMRYYIVSTQLQA